MLRVNRKKIDTQKVSTTIKSLLHICFLACCLFALWLPAIRMGPLVCAQHSIKRVLRLTMLLNAIGEIKDMHYWQGCKGTGGCNWKFGWRLAGNDN